MLYAFINLSFQNQVFDKYYTKKVSDCLGLISSDEPDSGGLTPYMHLPILFWNLPILQIPLI